MERFAVVADIHGNVLALEAVIADIARHNIDHVLNLGDHVSGPLWPQETVALLMQQPWQHISGNGDRSVVNTPPADHGASDRYAFEQLNDAQKRWLAELPARIDLPNGITLCHGTPDNDDQYLLELIVGNRTRLADKAIIAERLGHFSGQVLLCGHTHIPRVVRSGLTLIVNPGSVGLASYEDETPTPHAVENGSPHARYAILEHNGAEWQVELRAISYDYQAAAAQAAHNKRPDWESGLRTGFMQY